MCMTAIVFSIGKFVNKEEIVSDICSKDLIMLHLS